MNEAMLDFFEEERQDGFPFHHVHAVGKGGWEAFVMKGGHNALIQRTKRSQVRQYFTDYLFWKTEREGMRNGW